MSGPTTAGLGWVRSRIVRTSVGSTNDELRRLAAAGAPDGAILVADEQRAGRGRRGRTWHSPPGLGLYLSVLLRDAGPVAAATRWTIGAAVAAAEACRETARADVRIEWPNDLVAGGGKIGGILAESRSVGDTIDELVLGCGINVGHRASDFPPELTGLATSLRIAGPGEPPGRDRLAAAYLALLGEIASELRAGRWEPLAERWERLAVGAHDRAVRVRSGESHPRTHAGRTCGLDPWGALRVRGEDGRMMTVRLVDSVEAIEE